MNSLFTSFAHFDFGCIYDTKNLERNKLFHEFDKFHTLKYYVVITYCIFKGYIFNDGKQNRIKIVYHVSYWFCF